MASVAQIIRRRRQRRALYERREKRTLLWGTVFTLLIVLFVIVPVTVLFSSVGLVYASAMSRLPEPQETIRSDIIIGATEIFDASGQVLLFSVEDSLIEDRPWILLDELPGYVVQATVLQEDADFLDTQRFDPVQLLDRIWSNMLVGPLVYDTTLTGRLVRNVILPSHEQSSIEQVGQQFALVAEINRLHSAEEIVEWHLNTNYYGNEAYGIEAASQIYLGKSARDLTLDEAMLLAAIPTAPRFNPVDDETAARGRQGDLLRRMLTAGHITPSQFEESNNVVTAILTDIGHMPLVAPDFAVYAHKQAETILSSMGMNGTQLVSRGGLRIITTLDMDLYHQAECLMQTQFERLAGNVIPQVVATDGSQCVGAGYLSDVAITSSQMPPDIGEVVIIDATTGEILAMIGDGNGVQSQPGPMLSPFVYLKGMLSSNPNFTAASMLLDIPHVFTGAADGLIYQPTNADSQFRGPISLRDAMGSGLLVPAAQIANLLNINRVLRDTVYPMGINSLRDGIYDLSLLERGGTVSVLDMTYAYSIFAAMGQINGLRVMPEAPGLRNHDPVAIRQIEDMDGNILWAYNEEQVLLNREPRLQREAAFVINDILADDSTRWITLGQGNPLEMERQVAALSGITTNRIDNWAIGYTPQVVVGVRIGREDGQPIALNNFATAGAATIWRGVMDYFLTRDNIQPQDWPRPEAVVQSPVCEISGMSPNGNCDVHLEYFLDKDLIPLEDTYWEIVEINNETGQRATANTPTAVRSPRRYFIPPEDALDWWVANNRPLPPEDYDTVSLPDIFSSATILQPENLDIVGGEVTIRGSIDAENMSYYQLAYGEGANPAGWINITGQQDVYIPGTPLGEWDTSGLNGNYVLRLSVMLDNGTLDRGVVEVIVDNIPPTIGLAEVELRTLFRWPQDSTIILVADVTDNIGIDKVEFYHNGEFIGTDVEFPFEYPHNINRTGIEQFSAVAFDAVGNRTDTEITITVERSN